MTLIYSSSGDDFKKFILFTIMHVFLWVILKVYSTVRRNSCYFVEYLLEKSFIEKKHDWLLKPRRKIINRYDRALLLPLGVKSNKTC